MVLTFEAEPQILIIEDDEDTAEILGTMLEDAGYKTSTVDTGEIALSAIASESPDLVLCDVRLPGINGIEVIRSVRTHSYLPVIAISGFGKRSVDGVIALEAGADDYLSKPFTNDELIARVKALLRRTDWHTQATTTTIQVGDVILDMPRRSVTIKDKTHHLTPIEYGILTTLMRNVGRINSHDELLEAVWGDQYREDYSVLRVNISRLRQKIEVNPRQPKYVLTVPGKGYWMPKQSVS